MATADSEAGLDDVIASVSAKLDSGEMVSAELPEELKGELPDNPEARKLDEALRKMVTNPQLLAVLQALDKPLPILDAPVGVNPDAGRKVILSIAPEGRLLYTPTKNGKAVGFSLVELGEDGTFIDVDGKATRLQGGLNNRGADPINKPLAELTSTQHNPPHAQQAYRYDIFFRGGSGFVVTDPQEIAPGYTATRGEPFANYFLLSSDMKYSNFRGVEQVAANNLQAMAKAIPTPTSPAK